MSYSVDLATFGIVSNTVIDTNDGLRVMTLLVDMNPVFSNSTISSDLVITLQASFADANYIVLPQITNLGSGYYVMWIYGCVVKSVNQIAISCMRANSANGKLRGRFQLIAIGKKP